MQNLIKFNIISVLTETEITESYKSTMAKFYPEYRVDEPVYKVDLRVNSFGVEELKSVVWSKSQLEENKSKGFYMANV